MEAAKCGGADEVGHSLQLLIADGAGAGCVAMCNCEIDRAQRAAVLDLLGCGALLQAAVLSSPCPVAHASTICRPLHSASSVRAACYSTTIDLLTDAPGKCTRGQQHALEPEASDLVTGGGTAAAAASPARTAGVHGV